MKNYYSGGRKVFIIFNYTLLIFTSLICLFPFFHMLAVSFSSSSAAAAGDVKLWPVGFTVKSYEFVTSKPEFIRAFLITMQRLALGLPLNMLMIILVAYPLSRENGKFRWRNWYVWYFMITILFGGGLVPWYITIKNTGLLGSIWALVIPGAVPVFSIVILLNFFRELPKEIEEACFIDGAGHLTTLMRIYVPLSKPALATLVLFNIVGHWNSWFDGMILMNSPKDYPLQSYLQTVIIGIDTKLMTSRDLLALTEVNDQTSKAAQIFLGSLPILMAYPFLQKYFMKGIVLGSVKG